VIKVRVHIFISHSLKEKRSVIKSLLRRTQQKFSLSIAEVGNNELWQSSLIGVAIVGNNKRLLEREMEKVLAFMEQDSKIEIVEIQHEIWSFT
jgi:uncharacterized protein YlxP (DUF503 family)